MGNSMLEIVIDNDAELVALFEKTADQCVCMAKNSDAVKNAIQPLSNAAEIAMEEAILSMVEKYNPFERKLKLLPEHEEDRLLEPIYSSLMQAAIGDTYWRGIAQGFILSSFLRLYDEPEEEEIEAMIRTVERTIGKGRHNLYTEDNMLSFRNDAFLCREDLAFYLALYARGTVKHDAGVTTEELYARIMEEDAHGNGD